MGGSGGFPPPSSGQGRVDGCLWGPGSWREVGGGRGCEGRASGKDREVPVGVGPAQAPGDSLGARGQSPLLAVSGFLK